MSKRLTAVEIPDEIARAGGQAIAIYTKAISKGTSPRLAEMLALRAPPRGGFTDSTFFSGVGTLDKQIPDKHALQHLQKNAKRMGVTLTGNEFYRPELAEFPGDPRACVSQAQGIGHIKKRLIERGDAAEGAFTLKGRSPDAEPKPRHKIHPRLVRQLVQRERKDPANAKVDRRELVEKVIAKHGPKK